ncbi:MAG: FRG domain-containing protein [Candidatus Methylomirabilales bacterium]
MNRCSLRRADDDAAGGATKRPGWLEELLAWADEPCPCDAWIYRGQAAKFPTVLPGYLRPTHRKFFGNRLHSLDTSLVRLLMERTSRFTATQLFGSEMPVLPQPLAPSPSATIGGAAGPFHFAPTQAEATAALAQHYGLPTLYVDVCFDAVVAAFFATHERVDGSFRPSGEPGRVFRWPARRRTELLLEIDDPGRPDPADAWVDAMLAGDLRDAFKKGIEEAKRDAPLSRTPGLRIIDLTSMDQTVRRPHAQRGALACPIYFDGNPFAPEWLPGAARAAIPTPLEELCFSDMSQLPVAEELTLPSQAGEQLEAATGVSESALFPDRIDLGCSFFSVAALLSIVSWGSPDDLASAQALSIEGFKRRDALGKRLQRGLDAAGALIARESFRLLPRFPTASLKTSPSLGEAGDELRSQAAVAVEASRLMDSPENLEGRRQHAMLAAQELSRARRSVAAEFCRDFEEKTGMRLELPPDAFSVPPPIAAENLTSDHSWVSGEIRRRLECVEQILADANRLPAYAVLDPSLLPFDPDLFPTDDEYEETVRRQASALADWLDDDAFVTGSGPL